MPPANHSENLEMAFAARGNAALEARYDAWAKNYDADNAALGFRLPVLVSAFFARWVAMEGGPILDAGCGTGLAAESLSILGYRRLVGIDLSMRMLEEAHKTGVYEILHRMVLGDALDFPTDTFAATIATGVFTEGHAPSTSFEELIRVTRGGGHIIFNVRDDIYENGGFRDRQEQLESDGFWRLIEKSDRFRPFTEKDANVIARVFVYEVET
ncbi:MAG: class I SAM-dependent methyltransferase [Pseudomonadota bacterium]